MICWKIKSDPVPAAMPQLSWQQALGNEEQATRYSGRLSRYWPLWDWRHGVDCGDEFERARSTGQQ